MQILPFQPQKNMLPIDDWQDYRRDGEQFLRTATRALQKKKQAFTPEVIYNLVAMSIEKYIMALLMKRGDLAENHTMADLARALEHHTGPLPELARKLHYLDTFQEICDVDTYSCLPPSESEMFTIVAIGCEVQALLTPHLQD